MRPLPPSSAATRFLRYQFDNAAQLRRHRRALGVVAGMQSAISLPKRGPRRLALDQLA